MVSLSPYKFISEIQIGKVVNIYKVCCEFSLYKTVAAINPAPVTSATLLFPVT